MKIKSWELFRNNK